MDSTNTLLVLCAATLCVTLTLGLWPFHAPRNQVTWLENRNGLSLGRYGTVIGPRAFGVERAEDNSGGSLEIWLQPGQNSGGGTFLTFHDPKAALEFSMDQSVTNVELRVRRHNGRTAAGLYANDAFQKAGPLFTTITSGQSGTAVYLQGVLATRAPRLRLSTNEFVGTMILGDSSGQSDPWSGQIYGVAIYHCELSAAQVMRHYQAWTQRGRPQIADEDRNTALYFFDEHTGNTVRNHAPSGIDLSIPEHYQVVDKIGLKPFWNEFSMTQGYWGAALKNVVGFIPFGVCFYAYLSLTHSAKRAMLVTVALGTTVSVTIEVLQAYLPTRDSGTTDIITNAIGTWFGVLVYRRLIPILAQSISWLSPSPPPKSTRET